MSEDLDDKLERLRLLKKASADYEELRDEILKELTGQFWFVGADGIKYRAYPQPSDRTVYDIDTLRAEVSDEVFDAVTREVVDGAAFERAYRNGDIPEELMLRVMTYKPQKTTVRIKADD